MVGAEDDLYVRFHALIDKLEAGTITDDEYKELKEIQLKIDETQMARWRPASEEQIAEHKRVLQALSDSNSELRGLLDSIEKRLNEGKNEENP